ncbi:nucleotide disphospho-sugar-binding domain-containing protein [Actinosynnema sp. CS-041913]|uniref:nucleotide disphospho-sugar-binding domain-containing protein n=1 Tax=Actinosynnema sp. CS-041913 TaxID=3239917 RepID=UPI003D910CBC
MRIIFATWAWPSHLYALVPLAWACRTAGHEVLVVTEPELVGTTTRTGLPVVGVGAGGVDTLGLVRGYLTGGRPGGGAPRALEMVVAHAESMVDGLVDVIREFRADVVVYETTTMAGPIAAAATGVPAIRHLYGTDLLAVARPVVLDALAPVARRRGVESFEPLGVATVDPTPATLQGPTDYPRLPVRHVPFNGPGVAPRTAGRGDRPLVCVTWGHTIARLDPDRFLAGRVATAVADLDVDVVLAVSTSQLPMLGPVRDNVTVVVDTPVQHLFPNCDLVIGHGGASTVLTALGSGVPLLLVPQLPDHARHSARVAAVGAGTVLSVDNATGPELRRRAAEILDGDTERAAAHALRDEIRRMPPPTRVVDDIVTLAGQ